MGKKLPTANNLAGVSYKLMRAGVDEGRWTTEDCALECEKRAQREGKSPEYVQRQIEGAAAFRANKGAKEIYAQAFGEAPKATPAPSKASAELFAQFEEFLAFKASQKS
tara:strand:- start:226 stop:552 length:327 start_codon:yes stop_codon:yes gene_type:complete